MGYNIIYIFEIFLLLVVYCGAEDSLALCVSESFGCVQSRTHCKYGPRPPTMGVAIICVVTKCPSMKQSV